MDASHNKRTLEINSGVARVLTRQGKKWHEHNLRKGDALEGPPMTWLEVYPEAGAKFSVTAGEVTDFETFLRIIRGSDCNASASPEQVTDGKKD